MGIGFLSAWDSIQAALRVAADHWLVSLIAAVIILSVATVWKVGLGILNRLFRSVQVNGKWRTKIDRGNGWEDWEEAKLHQFVNQVWGTATITTGKRRTYRLRGEISGQMLCLLYRKTDNSGFDCGAVALEVNPDEREMIGFEVGYDRDRKDISPRAYQWTGA